MGIERERGTAMAVTTIEPNNKLIAVRLRDAEAIGFEAHIRVTRTWASRERDYSHDSWHRSDPRGLCLRYAMEATGFEAHDQIIGRWAIPRGAKKEREFRSASGPRVNSKS